MALKNSRVEEEMCTCTCKHAHTQKEIRRSQQSKEESATESDRSVGKSSILKKSYEGSSFHEIHVLVMNPVKDLVI